MNYRPNPALQPDVPAFGVHSLNTLRVFRRG